MNDPDMKPPIPPAVFLAPAEEPAPFVPVGWRHSDKTLVLEFRQPPAFIHDENDKEE